jgi:NAD(P)-dependent dehydrogenase (short-subunit alcohol dehydrogenase family)
MTQIIAITGASRGFGALAAHALAKSGHTVYAGMRDTAGRNAPQMEALQAHAAQTGVDLHAVELDVQSDPRSRCDQTILRESGRLDTVVHNGKRPFRVHIDPSQDAAEVVNGIADRVRAELLRRVGLADLLHPTA